MEYIIGAGAILESGSQAAITPASLHANVGDMPAGTVRALAVDFEGTSPQDVRKLLVAISGANSGSIRTGLERPLRAKGECSLADVLALLAGAANSTEVHLFAHWMPDMATCSALAGLGVRVLAHPLETIREAAVVSGQRHRRVA